MTKYTGTLPVGNILKLFIGKVFKNRLAFSRLAFHCFIKSHTVPVLILKYLLVAKKVDMTLLNYGTITSELCPCFLGFFLAVPGRH
jgi:hypothetical protein